MTIQLSVTVWTVICFVLLMLILHNLLFKPVLAVMDKRNKRIENAKIKKAEIEKIQSENDSVLSKKKKAFLEAQLKKSTEEIEEIRANSKLATQKAQEQRLRMVEEYHLKIDSEQSEILSVLEAHSVSLASSFADSLVKG
ncbi:MAG: hypothetical protein E7562_07785 [Ruminococcaceae bacterium]|nr:hypothetical protein [Oscillospiraceae bacterium]